MQDCAITHLYFKMACLEGESKREFRSKALKKLDNVLEGFVHSLLEIAEAENLMKEEMDAAVNHGPNFVWQSKLTHQLMAMLRPSVANLVKSIQERGREMQETLASCDRIFSVVCGNHAPKEDLMALLQLKTNTATVEKPHADVKGTIVSGSEYKAVKQRQASSVCRGNTCPHFCKDHHRVVDNVLWKKLPRELVERICATLPLHKKIELQKSVNLRSRMSELTSFRQACAEAHPNLSGIFWENTYDYKLSVFDTRFQKWLHLTVNFIPVEYLSNGDNPPLFGHDGGLVCFLPSSFEYIGTEERVSIFVFNPLTGDEKFIPLPDSIWDEKTEANLLLLQMDADGSYKLILVTGCTQFGGPHGSESYDSKSGLWSELNSGIIYGDGVFDCESRPIVFDCASKRMYMEPLPHATDYAFVRDKCFVLTVESAHSYTKVSECVWENKWNVTSTTPFGPPPTRCQTTRLLVSKRHMLTFAAVTEGDDKHRLQFLTLFDRETHYKRAGPRELPSFLSCELGNCDSKFSVFPHSLFFMCDLSFNAIP